MSNVKMLIPLKSYFSRIGLLVFTLMLLPITPRYYSQKNQESYDCLLVTDGIFRQEILDLRSGLRQSNPFSQYQMFDQWLPQEISPNRRYTARFKATDLWATTFDLVVDDHDTKTTATILKDAAEMNRSSMLPNYQLVWSPDSEWVAFSQMFMVRPENYLVIFKADGSRVFHSNRSIWFLDWSNDSQYLVLLEFTAPGEPQIDVWSSETAEMQTVYSLATEKHADRIAWSPTGHDFAFLESTFGVPTDSALKIISVDTGTQRLFPLQSTLWTNILYGPELYWSPDGQNIVLGYDDLNGIYRLQIFPGTGGDPIDVAEGESQIRFTWVGNGVFTLLDHG